MSEIDLLADKIEQAVRETFAAAEQESGMWNYALLFNPEKSKTWVIVLFFEDKVQLKNSLNNGFCYSVQQFLQEKFILIDNQLPISIRFDTGQYPSNKTEYEQLLEKHTAEYDPLNNEKGQHQICSKCGHDWGKHKMYCIDNSSQEGWFPQEGWMACPEEDCFCFLTWDVPIGKNYKGHLE